MVVRMQSYYTYNRYVRIRIEYIKDPTTGSIVDVRILASSVPKLLPNQLLSDEVR
jgi:hypothetical protein